MTIITVVQLHSFYTQINKDDWKGANQIIRAQSSTKSPVVIIYPTYNTNAYSYYIENYTPNILSISSVQQINQTNLEAQDIWLISANTNTEKDYEIKSQIDTLLNESFINQNSFKLLNINMTHYISQK